MKLYGIFWAKLHAPGRICALCQWVDEINPCSLKSLVLLKVFLKIIRARELSLSRTGSSRNQISVTFSSRNLPSRTQAFPEISFLGTSQNTNFLDYSLAQTLLFLELNLLGTLSSVPEFNLLPGVTIFRFRVPKSSRSPRSFQKVFYELCCRQLRSPLQFLSSHLLFPLGRAVGDNPIKEIMSWKRLSWS